MKNKTAFVIGINSFSGSSFAKYLLDKNFKVYGFGRSKFPEKHFAPYHYHNLTGAAVILLEDQFARKQGDTPC